MRRTAAFLLLTLVLAAACALAVGNVRAAFAGGGEADLLQGVSEVQQEQQEQGEIQDRGGTFEKIVASLVEFPLNMAQGLLKAGGFQDLDRLIFLHGLSAEERAALPWTGADQAAAVRDFFKLMCLVTAPFWVVAVAATAFRFLHAGTNPAARAEAWESVQRWFLALGMVALAPLAVQLLMTLTGVLVDATRGAFQAKMAALGRDVTDLQEFGKVCIGGVKIQTGSFLGSAIVKVAFLFLFCYLNVLYIVRRLAITVFFVFTPVMALLGALNRNVMAAGIWLGELASNAFMPFAHALVLSVILLLADIKSVSKGDSWLTIIILFYTLIPLAEAIRNSVQGLFTRMAGFGEERAAWHGFLAGAGLGGLGSMGRGPPATLGGGRPARRE